MKMAESFKGNDFQGPVNILKNTPQNESEAAQKSQKVVTEADRKTVVKQSITVMSRVVLEKVKNIKPATKIFLEKEGASEDYHGLAPKELKKKAKQISEDMEKTLHQPLLANVVQAVDVHDLVASKTSRRLAEEVFVTSHTDWGQVNLFLNVFAEITKHVMSEYHLETLLRNSQDSIPSYAAEWIYRQGGWMAYDSVQKHIDAKKAIEVLLAEAEHYMVFVCDFPTRSRNSPEENLIAEIVHHFSKVHKTPKIFVTGDPHFSTQIEEVRLYSQFSNAVFISFVSPNVIKSRQLTQSYEETLSYPDVRNCRANLVLPVEIFGLKPNEMPLSYKRFRCLKAFPKMKWKSSDVVDFVGHLHSEFNSMVQRDLTDILTPKTDNQLDIKLVIAMTSSKLSDEERQTLIMHIKQKVKDILEDSWMTVRQRLLHMYKIRNIRVVNVEGENHLTLEVLVTSPGELEKILDGYSSGQLQAVFPDHINTPDIREPYTLSVEINESHSQTLLQHLQRDQEYREKQQLKESINLFVSGESSSVSSTSSAKNYSRIIGKMANEMIVSDKVYFEYDLYTILEQKANKINVIEVTDDVGRNLLHMIILGGRLEFLKVIFYMNMWDKLRLVVINPQKDTQYGGYSTRGLAEKLLFKSKGPNTLEEYDHFDNLWMSMPLLHKACLAGNLTYVKVLVDQGEDIHATDCVGAACILYACAVGSVPIVNYLMEKGADPKLDNKRGEDGLFLATMFGKTAVIRLLLARFTFPSGKLDHQKNRALDYVAINGDIDSLEVYRESGVPVEEKLLPIAVYFNRQAFASNLLSKYSVRVDGVDDKGRTALLNASLRGSSDLLSLLLEKGSDIQERDPQNRSCFHAMAEFNHHEACGFIIRKANEIGVLSSIINDRDFYSGRERLVVVRGRDRGLRAWHYVSVKRTLISSFKNKMITGQIDVKNYGDILRSGFGQNPPKSYLDELEEKIASELRQKKLDMTPLSLATWKNKKEVALLLLDAGADPNIADSFGCTSLHYAAMQGDIDLALKMEKKGANLLAKNNENKTPAEIAEENDHGALVNFLKAEDIFNQASAFRGKLESTKERLSAESLTELRSQGVDIRRHLITTLRDLTIDINSVLLDVDSGPVLEESMDSHELQTSDPMQSAFSGIRDIFIDLPGLPFSQESSSALISQPPAAQEEEPEYEDSPDCL